MKKTSKKDKKTPKKTKKRTSRSRRLSLYGGIILFVLFAIWAWIGAWFVHLPPETLAEQEKSLPSFIYEALLAVGDPVADITDGLGWTGTDVVYEYDTEAPEGEVLFAGAPKRIGEPAPKDIQVIDKGEFIIGWSPSLRHPVWVAYHVPVTAQPSYDAFPPQIVDGLYEVPNRPQFRKDPQAPSSPEAGAYAKSGFDRGHMAPNFAIASRFGSTAQKKTFYMSNIAPQRPSLNRGIWRNVEHRIAELWPAKWGEVWVIVGCFTPIECPQSRLASSNVDIPEAFYQIMVCQSGMDVRVQALLFHRKDSSARWPLRFLVSVDELERQTGLDFFPELPEFIQRPMESSRPTRLWPTRFIDTFKKLSVILH